MTQNIINKNYLDQSIKFISDLQFNENDYRNISEKFEPILKCDDYIEILKKLKAIKDIENDDDMRAIMRKISDNISLKDLNTLLEGITKNEELIDFIQDLFLEKLI